MMIPLEQNRVKLDHLRDQTAPKRLRLQLSRRQVFAASQNRQILKETHLCCDIVKQIIVCCKQVITRGGHDASDC
jgi:hypothetical protein